MQALLLSPATRFLSPDSSSSLSPSTPPLPSLDFLSIDPDNSTRQTDTPSHSSSSTSTTRQLVQSPTPTPTHPLPLPGSNNTLPRVPSILRYQYNPSQSLSYPDTVNNAQSQESNHSTFHFTNSPPRSHSPPPPLPDTSLQLIDFHQPSSQPHSPNTSTTSSPSSDAQGTFIYNSVIVNSTRQVPGGGEGEGEGEENEQLAAAIRAFKTPKSAGLFEGEAEESSLNDDENGEIKIQEGWKGGGGAGLMSLFQEPLELINEKEKDKSSINNGPLPRSIVQAPSLSQFSFTSYAPAPKTSESTSSESLPFSHYTPLIFQPTQTPSTPSFLLLGGDKSNDSQSTPLANIPALIATPQPLPLAGGKKGKALYGVVGEERTPGIFRTRTRGVAVAEEPIAGPGRKERFLKRSVVKEKERKEEEEEEEGNFSTTEEEFESARSREYRESLLLYPTKSEDDDSSSSDDEDGGQGGLSEESEPLSASGGRGEGVFIRVEGMSEMELRENGFMSTSEEEEEEEDHSSSSSESEEEEEGRQEEGEGFSSQEEEVGGQSVRNRSDRNPLQSSHPHPHSHSHLAPPPPPPPLLSHHQLLPASPMRLFQSTYDTYTRNHLNEIVDLVIDSTTPPEEGDSNSSEEGFLGEEGRVRSSKRIRLSPPSPPSGRSMIRYNDREEDDDEETPIKKGDRQSGWGEWEERSRRRSRRRRSSSITTATTMRSRRRSIGGGGRRNDATTPSLRDRKFVEASGEEAEEEERKERVRDRKSEATELMEKIRKRSEEREIRRKGLKSSNEEIASSESLDSTTTTNTKTLPASPRKISISSANRSPLPLTPSLVNSNASPPPPLAHLAAAATASLRSVLASPAPSPRIPSSSSSSTRQQQRTVGLGFSREFPSSIVKGLEKGGTITGGGGGGKRVFSIASPLLKQHQEEEGTSIVPQATPGHKRRTSLTTIHPSSIDAQRLLASVVGSSKDGKGMQFDSEMGRWIRTPNRKRIVSSPTTTQGAVVEEKEEEEEEEEEDPFKDFSELQSPPQSQSQSQHSSQPSSINEPPRSQSHLKVPPLPSPSIPPSPVSTLSRADLDHLPLPGDGSGSLKLYHFDLSGLGISKGTPPLLVPPSTKDSQQLDKSPEGACYFDSQPEEVVAEIGETPLLRLEEEVEEEEDSASWGEERLPEKKELVEPRRPSLFPSPPLLLRTHSEPPSLPPTTPSHVQHTQSAPPSSSTPFPPRSALKPCRAQTDPTGFHTSSTNLVASLTSTPIRAGQGVQEPKLPRSVSFSDGKRHGKIRGLESWEKDKDKGSKLRYEVGKASSKTSGAVDLDGKGGAFGELEMDESVADAEESWEVDEKEQEQERRDEAKSVTDDTPRASQTRQSSRVSEPSEETSLVLSAFDSASPAHHRSSATHTASRSRTFSRTANSRNGTFLTECSFGVSHDRLLQYITDVEPFEPDWEGLTSIDLSGKKAESVVRLKEFLPRLDEVNLNHNEISYLTGIPSTLRTLLIASNRLTSLTSFNHLHNLERLDLSNNQLDSVQHLSALRHLRDLKVDGNQITSIEGLGELDGLVRLSLKGNQLTGDVDLGKTKWSRLETLHLAHNKIESLTGLEQLHSLTSLNLDHNSLTSLDPPSSLTRLRILRLCNNPISHIDVSFAPKLRTIYIDSARLGVVQGTEHLRKLENLSVRDQSGAALTLAMPHIRDVKRLYLSGNPLPSSFPSEKFFNLTYLELAMCQLTSLPPNLASLVPNVRTLNLDFNFLESLEPLRGLTRLGKLSVVGARLNKVRPVIGVLQSLVELESLDMRMNPITLAFYPPLGPVTDSLLPSHREHRILHPDSLPSSSSSSSSTTTTTFATSSTAPDFTTLDSKFRKALPDEWYFKRSAYRAALMHAVPTLIKLDGIDCTRERKKVRKVIEKLRGGNHEA